MPERRAGDAHQRIDRDAFRMRIQRGKLVEQADAIVLRLPKTYDSPAADCNSRFSDRCKGCAVIVVIMLRV